MEIRKIKCIKLKERRITIEALEDILARSNELKADFIKINYYESKGDPYGGYHPEDCDNIEFYRCVSDEELKEEMIKRLEEELKRYKTQK